MRILFYTMTLQSGGAERVITNLANYFSKTNDVAILNLYNNKCAYDLNKNIKIFFPTNNKKLNFKYLLQVTNDYSPDILIAFCPTMCFLSCTLKIFCRSFKKIKLIVSERNDPRHEYTNFFLKICANFLYSKANGIIFQTEEAKNFFNKKIQKKSLIIFNPINEKFINTNFFVNNKSKIIINVGRLEKQKNHKLLIDACKIVFNKHPDYSLIIYGNGSLETDLRNYIASIGLSKKIILAGLCSNLEEKFLNCKMFVLSSNYEGIPNALMEAMAIGLPCISTDCPSGGPRILVKNLENGILVNKNDKIALADAIEKIINDPKLALRLGNNAKKIAKKYSIKKICDEWNIFIKNI